MTFCLPSNQLKPFPLRSSLSVLMEIDPDQNNSNNEGDDGSCSILRSKIAELERKLLHEKDRYDQLQSDSQLAKLVSNQEADRYRRDCLSLKRTVARLDEDRKVLLEDMEGREREFTEKIIELKMESRDLECGKKRAQDEAREYKKKCAELEARMSQLVNGAAIEIERKEREAKEKFAEAKASTRPCAEESAKGKEHGELEARILKLVQENFHLVEKKKGAANAKAGHEGQVDGKMQQNGAEWRQKEDLQPPESSGKCVLIMADSGSEGDEDDKITLRQLGNKRLGEEGAKKGLGSKRESSVSSAKVADAQVPSRSANNKGEESNRGPKSKKKLKPSDLSCSPTARNPGSSGYSGVAGKVGRASHRRKSKNQTSQRVYTGRITSPEQHLCAKKRAETLQSNLKLCNPSFIKSMTQSHVSGSFYMALPSEFCKENLPFCDMKIILKDVKGLEYEVNYLYERNVLSGGWRRFALDHKLEIGDALIFELSGPTRFKVYIVKSIQDKSSEDFDEKIAGGHTNYCNNNEQRVIEMKNIEKVDMKIKQEG